MLRTFFLICLSCAALAAQVARAGHHALAGAWQSRSASGVTTQFEIHANGRFVLRQEHASDLRRDYLCGTLDDSGDALVLKVGAKKERLSNGDIEELVGQETLVLPVHQRSSQTLIIDYKNRTIVLTQI